METIYSNTLSILEDRGWCQGGTDGKGYNSQSGEVCLEWAIYMAVGSYSFSLVESSIKDHLGLGPGTDLWMWNDHPNTTFADVKSVLVAMHEEGSRALEIGEPLKEVEFEPIPETAPVEEPVPAEVPEKELEPA